MLKLFTWIFKETSLRCEHILVLLIVLIISFLLNISYINLKKEQGGSNIVLVLSFVDLFSDSIRSTCKCAWLCCVKMYGTLLTLGTPHGSTPEGGHVPMTIFSAKH